MAEFASRGVANAGLTTGVIGTALGVLNGGLGLINKDNPTYVTKTELDYVQALGQKDCEIALLKSEQNTEIKIADVYERIMSRVLQNERDQRDWNASQSVANAQMSSAIATNATSIAGLQAVCSNITKVIVPKDAICPEFMNRYNSWTAPTE